MGGVYKEGAGLYLKLMTKAYLCWRAPLAVLMRIKRLWVHSSWQRLGGGWVALWEHIASRSQPSARACILPTTLLP